MSIAEEELAQIERESFMQEYRSTTKAFGGGLPSAPRTSRKTIVETLHHGNFRQVTLTPLQGDELTEEDAEQAVENSPYIYRDRTESVYGDLRAFGRADLGWSTFTLESA